MWKKMSFFTALALGIGANAIKIMVKGLLDQTSLQVKEELQKPCR